MSLNKKVVITDDNKKYLIIEIVEYKNRIFAYLVNGSNNSDSMFAEIIEDGSTIKTIVPEFFESIILPLFQEKFMH